MSDTAQQCCSQCRRSDIPLHKLATTKALSGYGETVRTAEVVRWLCDECLREAEAKEQVRRVLDYRPDDSEAPQSDEEANAAAFAESAGLTPDYLSGRKQPPPPICGTISHSGPHGEPLACAYPPNHDGDHSWATLPTFVDGKPLPLGTLDVRGLPDVIELVQAVIEATEDTPRMARLREALVPFGVR